MTSTKKQRSSHARSRAYQRGLATVEYAVAGGLVVAALVSVFPAIGAAATTLLNDLLAALQ